MGGERWCSAHTGSRTRASATAPGARELRGLQPRGPVGRVWGPATGSRMHLFLKSPFQGSELGKTRMQWATSSRRSLGEHRVLSGGDPRPRDGLLMAATRRGAGLAGETLAASVLRAGPPRAWRRRVACTARSVDVLGVFSFSGLLVFLSFCFSLPPSGASIPARSVTEL
ncbi:hypothetical protein HJG60_007729 [Phyllostomus discolor]|uniref:Uncharacterized protein n=1 Tax=Phyllostomus discolor TaxID=89673 RepID=A0A834EV21_9CHIR|nr:hypothetical protein HJG60_007729 [Phyllostomus discolor]